MDRARSLPTGVVTFLLTDVEDSSGHWRRDEAAPTIARQCEVIADIVGAHGGVRVVEQGGGHSTVNVFSFPADATAAAIAIHLALAREGWPAEELKVRIGIHSGPTETVEERALSGATAIRCARLRDLAHGGQTLLSAAAAALVLDSLPAQCVLTELPEVFLNGLSRPERPHDLGHPELPRSVRWTPTDATSELPFFPTSFVGREAEIAELLDVIGGSWLTTITGTGGSGKTRLAHQVAQAGLPTFEAGMVWVDLSPIDSPSRVASAVAQACGISQSPGGAEPHELIVRHLRSFRRLVVLDNCEHLVGAVASLLSIVASHDPHSVVLATSREPLGVPGETVWRVPSLSFAAPKASTSEDTIGDGARLFLDRAHAARPDMDFGPHAATIERICRRLDGVPLAIELAAARTRALSVDELARALDDRFRLLTSGPRALERHRTLVASIDWSHNLLDGAEQLLFRRLSVFAQNFGLRHAEAVVSDSRLGRLEVFDLLARLVDKSLVQHSERDGYSLLESIRHYASQKAADAGELETIRDRHAAHFGAMANVWALDRQLASAELTAELASAGPDLRLALDWVLPRDPDLVPILLRPIVHELGMSCQHRDADVLVQRVCSGLVERSPQWCEALAASMCYLWVSAPGWWGDGARAALEELADLDPLVRRWLEFGLLGFSLLVGVEGVAERVERLIDAAGEDGDDAFVVRVSTLLAFYCATAGDLPRAESHLDWIERRATDSPEIISKMRSARVWVDVCHCDLDRAVAHTEAMFARAVTEAEPYIAGALAAWFTGSADLMERIHRDALRQDFTGYSEAVPHFTDIWTSLIADDVNAAQRAVDQMLRSPISASMAQAKMVAASIALAVDDVEQARQQADHGLLICRDADAPFAFVGCLGVRAEIARLDGDLPAALSLCHQVIDIAVPLGLTFAVISAIECLATVLADDGRTTEAGRLLGGCVRSRSLTGFSARYPRAAAEVEATRATLDAADLEAGESLSMDDLVAYVTRSRGARTRPTTGWEALTPAEQKVVGLAADGLSNRQIAERCFIGVSTVKTHLVHAYQKLGMATRSELVAAAARRQPSPPG